MSPLRPSYANVVATLALVVALSGTAVAAGLPRASVGALQLKANAVTGAKIRPGAVTGTKLAANAVTAPKLANGSVTAPKLGTGSVTTPKIAPGAITPDQLSAAARSLAESGPQRAVAIGSATSLPTVDQFTTASSRHPIIGTSTPSSVEVFGIGSKPPAFASVVRDLEVTLFGDVPAGGSVVVSVRSATQPQNDGPVVTSCTITGTASPDDRSCTAPAAAAIPPGSYLRMIVVVSGAPGGPTYSPVGAYWSFTLAGS